MPVDEKVGPFEKRVMPGDAAHKNQHVSSVLCATSSASVDSADRLRPSIPTSERVPRGTAEQKYPSNCGTETVLHPMSGSMSITLVQARRLGDCPKRIVRNGLSHSETALHTNTAPTSLRQAGRSARISRAFLRIRLVGGAKRTPRTKTGHSAQFTT
jgi:hypothetical protein